MVDFARVDSIDALRALRTALAGFVEEVSNALAEASAEIQNAGMWLRQEQQGYWKLQGRKRTELLNRAKIELMQKQHSLSSGSGQSCVDEKKALAKAQRLYEEAEQKIRNVKRWMRVLDDEAFNFKAQIQGVRQAIEVDVPRAMAALERMAQALQAYADLEPMVIGSREEARHDMSSMSRPMEIETAQPTDPATCKALRELTPAAEARMAVLIQPQGPTWLETFGIEESQQDDLAELPVAHCAVDAGDVVAWGQGDQVPERVYLERSADGGWYVGFADGIGLTGLVAMRVSDLMTVRPDWRSMLTLPVGSLVILASGGVEAVFDGEDQLIWSQP